MLTHHYPSGYIHSRASALDEFLGSPSTRAGMTNEQVIESVVGASIGKPTIDVVDPATYDTISTQTGTPCRTFREAFEACAVCLCRTGHRYWQNFDLRALNDCCEEFRALRLPEWVERLLLDKEIAEYNESYASDAATGVDEEAAWA